MSTDGYNVVPSTPPLPNSYWVEPGRLLAGEYPGGISRPEAMQRLELLLRAGITSFVDLTEDGEMPPYDAWFAAMTEQHIRYRRLAIHDHDVPDSDRHMAEIVDAIEQELAAGHRVYVHCRAGIGRTGMSIACHLIRQGLSNDAALARLNVLWRQCARSRQWPTVPETPEQQAFVRQWRDPGAHTGESVVEGRREGMLVGLAIGDALGTMAATSQFDAGTLLSLARTSQALPQSLSPGMHTALTRAVADSLLAHGGHDADDQMQRYAHWLRTAADVSVPPDFKRAVAAFQWSRRRNPGSHDPKNLDSHSLPRTAAAALYCPGEAAIELAADVSRTTQQSPVVLDLCRVWAASFSDALQGASKRTLTAFAGPAMSALRRRTLKPQVAALLNAPQGQQEEPGNALFATRCAFNAFAESASWRDAVIRAAVDPGSTTAAAALCGALAGAHYGVDGVPLEWRRQLAEETALRTLARRLAS